MVVLSIDTYFVVPSLSNIAVVDSVAGMATSIVEGLSLPLLAVDWERVAVTNVEDWEDCVIIL